MAGFVSETDLLECLEVELVKEKQFGQILLEQGLVTHDLLETAIVLQDMVANGTLRAWQAAEALRQVKDRQVSVYQAVAELDPPAQMPQKTISPRELIVMSKVADESQVAGLITDSESSSIKVGKKFSPQVSSAKRFCTSLCARTRCTTRALPSPPIKPSKRSPSAKNATSA